ncbi:hypothetical protein HYPSUDRAFT_36931 [Hypholoma sublateritium FD-334 SS-4]|uniref:Uncharacterized protein n=1 Tax=Hypholoma sublateritium (strain FD-334 SS-4) TaxID=945553 RepID=A0A0D2P584_HYPSF|nr:hypothetical protein HYPSUDRAFT_36931 [Hypholoma sublateritium FD-334 SS-4]
MPWPMSLAISLLESSDTYAAQTLQPCYSLPQLELLDNMSSSLLDYDPASINYMTSYIEHNARYSHPRLSKTSWNPRKNVMGLLSWGWRAILVEKSSIFLLTERHENVNGRPYLYN